MMAICILWCILCSTCEQADEVSVSRRAHNPGNPTCSVNHRMWPLSLLSMSELIHFERFVVYSDSSPTERTLEFSMELSRADVGAYLPHTDRMTSGC